MKNNKGITLVALIVTIIILLILAGVSIATLTESGLFEKARQAEQKSENAQIKEETTLAEYENKIGEYIDGSRDEVAFSTTELLSSPAVVTTTTSWPTHNKDFTLNSSIENYKMLLITFGNWNNTISMLNTVNTIYIPVDQIKLLNSDGNTEDYYFTLEAPGGSNYTTGNIRFMDNTTLRIYQAGSSNTSRTHFAITSVLGIK